MPIDYGTPEHAFVARRYGSVRQCVVCAGDIVGYCNRYLQTLKGTVLAVYHDDHLLVQREEWPRPELICMTRDEYPHFNVIKRAENIPVDDPIWLPHFNRND